MEIQSLEPVILASAFTFASACAFATPIVSTFLAFVSTFLALSMTHLTQLVARASVQLVARIVWLVARIVWLVARIGVHLVDRLVAWLDVEVDIELDLGLGLGTWTMDDTRLAGKVQLDFKEICSFAWVSLVRDLLDGHKSTAWLYVHPELDVHDSGSTPKLFARDAWYDVEVDIDFGRASHWTVLFLGTHGAF